jgi:hypothetical protein
MPVPRKKTLPDAAGPDCVGENYELGGEKSASRRAASARGVKLVAPAAHGVGQRAMVDYRYYSGLRMPVLPNVPMTEAWALPNNYYTELDVAAKARAEKAVEDASERIKSGKASRLEIVTEINNGHAKDVILERIANQCKAY